MTKHYPKFDMKRSLILILFLSLIFSATVFAQKGAGHRQKWMKEMQQAKIEFMTKELDITEQQKARFAETMIAMEKELGKLRGETRSMEKSIKDKNNATDLEYEKAAEAMFEFKSREGAIEKKYYTIFKQFLTPQQLFKFYPAERKWMKTLMKHRKK